MVCTIRLQTVRFRGPLSLGGMSAAGGKQTFRPIEGSDTTNEHQSIVATVRFDEAVDICP